MSSGRVSTPTKEHGNERNGTRLLVAIIVGKGRRSVAPQGFVFFGKTAQTTQPNGNKRNTYPGIIFRCRWIPPKMDVDNNLTWHVCVKYTVRIDSAGEAQDSALTLTRFFTPTCGTERKLSRVASFRSARSQALWIKLRHVTVP